MKDETGMIYLWNLFWQPSARAPGKAAAGLVDAKKTVDRLDREQSARRRQGWFWMRLNSPGRPVPPVCQHPTSAYTHRIMHYLHAYWRMAYIEAPKRGGDRPFTELPALGDDQAAGIIHRSRHAYLMLNCYPYNAGHLLAIPFREVPDLEDLKSEERGDLWEEIRYGKRLLTETLRPEGFNIGFNLGAVAGGSLASHLHAHIVPRWQGDNNFMPVLADTKVLPQALATLWEKLSAAARRLPREGIEPEPAAS